MELFSAVGYFKTIYTFFLLYKSASECVNVVKQFYDAKHEGTFNHLIVHNVTGKLYVGGVNRLYQLDADLKLEVSSVTGPKPDNPKCVFDDCANKKLTNSYTKVLLIDYDNLELLFCTSLFQGTCEKRPLSDIGESNFIRGSFVANDEHSSTVAFIAPGPSLNSRSKKSNVLYIAVTSVGNLGVRAEIPAFCMRNLTSLKVYYKGIPSRSGIKIESQQRSTFLVTYVYGFSYENFSYILSIQRASIHSKNYVSKIFRICQGDKNFYSYTEIPLYCTSLGRNYNIILAATVGKPSSSMARSLNISVQSDVLFAVFAQSYVDKITPTNNAALCIYSLKYIGQIFHRNVKDCFNGIGRLGPGHFMPERQCQITQIHIEEGYCGKHEVNHPIAGSIPISSEASLVFRSGVVPSSISINEVNDFVVAFVGLKDGHLLKVSLKTVSQSEVYENLTVDSGSSVNADMPFDLERKYLYVMSSRRISKISVEFCAQYKTCITCMEARDPHCGWCSLQDRCAIKESCPVSDQWLPPTSDQCIIITSLVPSQIQVQENEVKEVKITIQSFARSKGDYQCEWTWNNFNYLTEAYPLANNNGVTCDSPPYSQLAHLFKRTNLISLKLAVLVGGRELVSTTFKVFDCSRHTQCSSCVDSEFGCTWCVDSYRCTHDISVCLGDHRLVYDKKKTNHRWNGPLACPLFNHSSKQFLIGAGIKGQVTVSTKNIPKLIYQSDLRCIFTTAKVTVVRARRKGRFIICGEVMLSYVEEQATYDVMFDIVWGKGNNTLDNPYNITVKLYKCQHMASSCSYCLTASSGYPCGWCEGATPSCQLSLHCDDGPWYDKSQHCPAPQIYQFSPTKGPKAGGTNVTISGINLGKSMKDVRILGIPCTVMEFINGIIIRIICQTDMSDTIGSSRIKVLVANRYSAISKRTFTYVDPLVTRLWPRMGPRDGGTIITIYGRHLDAGSNITVHIGKHVCHVDRSSITSDSLKCVTSAVDQLGGHLISLSIDNFSQEFPLQFFYLENPVIHKLSEGKLSSVISGGLLKVFLGSNLNITADPKLIFWLNKTPYKSTCISFKADRLICPTPNLLEQSQRNINNLQIVSFGFEMDSVKNVHNLSSVFGFFRIHVNPIINKFKDGHWTFSGNRELLHITGQNMYPITSDYIITIGDQQCGEVLFISKTKIRCSPPKVQPMSLDDHKYPLVTVNIGNFSAVVGRIVYEKSQINSMIEIGIGAGVGVLVLVFMIVCIFVMVLRRKSRKSNTMIKKYHQQMDMLSSKVAQECKAAFTELQMNMTSELTNKMSKTISVPYWDYHVFCMNILFANDVNHPVKKNTLEIHANKEKDIEKGFGYLYDLICNRDFLLTFLRTLERDQRFLIQDRVNMASLVSLIFFNRLYYLTDILKALLSDLIARNSHSKENNPKILLRRTESIAEKMLTNWFTFLLYKYLRNCVGEPLYLLYQAIKQQVSSGPVDAILGESRYALSEDKLIRQKIDFRPMVLNVPDVNGDRYHQVKVLDCDSISQVKEKVLDAVYRNSCVNPRPLPDEVDLEWNLRGHSQNIILQDLDHTSLTDGSFQRINTLSHYKVPDQAAVSLVFKQTSLYSSTLSSDKSAKLNGDYVPLFRKNSSMGRPSLQGQTVVERNQKVYHLVKPADDFHRENDRGSKIVPEVYLTILLKTKGTLQHFVDNLIESIFSTSHRDQALPAAIKYMFDFLDDQGALHGIHDPEVIHSWKSNSLPLRFWVNIIKNPNFVFDTYKSNTVDSFLSVIAQTFMDSCSKADNTLGINSPSSKLLYVQEIPRYKKWVDRYYSDIKSMPSISEQDMFATLEEASGVHADKFNISVALAELYKYMQQYSVTFQKALECDQTCRRHRFVERLLQVHSILDGSFPTC